MRKIKLSMMLFDNLGIGAALRDRKGRLKAVNRVAEAIEAKGIPDLRHLDEEILHSKV